jgi:hypothetical protein
LKELTTMLNTEEQNQGLQGSRKSSLLGELQLVPVEPTEEMYDVGYDVLREIHAGPFNGSPSFGHAGKVFRAMVAAAPVMVAAPALNEPLTGSAGWVSVGEDLPPSGLKVIVFYCNSHGRTRRTMAHYAAKHTLDASHWDEGATDDTEDGIFEPEGWWEEPVESEVMSFISDEVTHWMRLPAAPV